MKKYTHTEMHNALSAQSTGRIADVNVRAALFCPYYTQLRGVLGTDWGAVLNPESSRFGLLTFEHDDCGCEPGTHEEGHQRTDEWRDRKRERERTPDAAGSSQANGKGET